MHPVSCMMRLNIKKKKREKSHNLFPVLPAGN